MCDKKKEEYEEHERKWHHHITEQPREVWWAFGAGLLVAWAMKK